MEKKEQKIPLKKLDELFTAQDERDALKQDYVVDIDITKIDTFKNHPFKVEDNTELRQMSESIRENGVLNPIIVRPTDNGRYEIVSGHRRKMACELIGKQKISAIVKNLTDDEATIIMVDSNMQRERILPSEKAFAYKMKMDALKNQGKRTDLTSYPLDTKLDNISEIGKINKDSRAQVYRHIRITYLIPEFIDMIDNEIVGREPKMGLRVGVELSFLTNEEQNILLDRIDFYGGTPTLSQAQELKKLSQKGKYDIDSVDEVMGKQKPNQIQKYNIPRNKIANVLPKSLIRQEEIEDYIVKAVIDYSKRQKLKDYVR